MSCGIYQIRIADKSYVGSSQHLERREKDHRRKLCYGTHRNPYLQAAWNKYQEFEWIVLEECSVEELLAREQVQIDSIYGQSTCMNLSPTAGRTTGYRPPEDVKEKLRRAAKNRPPISDETRRRMSEAQKRRPPRSYSGRDEGRVFSDEHRQRISEGLTGKKHSSERRQRSSERMKAIRAQRPWSTKPLP